MKLWKYGVWVIFLLTGSLAQTVTVRVDGQNYPARMVEPGIWHVQFHGEDYFLLPRGIVDSLTQKIALQKARLRRDEQVTAVLDSLVQRYEAYQRAAERHIQAQQQLIWTADSLYRGYKGLYKDVRKLVGRSAFSLSIGIGLADFPDKNWRPIGNVGVGYRNWEAWYQAGGGHRAVLVGFRWPLGW